MAHPDTGEEADENPRATAGETPAAPPIAPPVAAASAKAATPPPPPPDPARGAALAAEAEALWKAAELRKAVDTYEQAVQADPTSAKIHGDYGHLLRDLTAIDRALSHLRQAAELDAANPDRWIDLANAYYLKPNPGEAWAAEEKARQAEPGLQLHRGAGGFVERAGDSAPGKE